jgi:hypothetical protein
MLTGIAVVPTRDFVFPGSWAFVLGVLLLIVLIFIRMYVWGDRSGRRTARRAGRAPERGKDHGQRTVSRRRPNRP